MESSKLPINVSFYWYFLMNQTSLGWWGITLPASLAKSPLCLLQNYCIILEQLYQNLQNNSCVNIFLLPSPLPSCFPIFLPFSLPPFSFLPFFLYLRLLCTTCFIYSARHWRRKSWLTLFPEGTQRPVEETNINQIIT